MIDPELCGDQDSTKKYFQRLEILFDKVELEDDLRRSANLSQEYYTELPYHNFEHAIEVAERAIALAEEAGLNLEDKTILLMAALWHDAFFAEPLQDGDISKEHRSAIIAYDAIIMNSSEDKLSETFLFAQEVQRTILATNLDTTIESKLGQILNTADLANLYGDDIQLMLKETGALYIENLYLDGNLPILDALMVAGENMEIFEVWVTNARNYVDALIQKKLDPESSRTLKAIKNVQQMTSDNLIEIFKKIKA